MKQKLLCFLVKNCRILDESCLLNILKTKGEKDGKEKMKTRKPVKRMERKKLIR